MTDLNEMIKFDPKSMSFTLEADALEWADNAITTYTKERQWGLFAEQVGRLVNLNLPYVSYVPAMYDVQRVATAPNQPRVSKVDYVGAARVSSPTNTSTYVRATHTFVEPTIEFIEGGGWYHMRDSRYMGWNGAMEVAKQISWEMAKKLDTWLGTILDAAIPVGNTDTITALDFDTFRGVVADAEAAGYPVSRAILAKSRAMDTADWGTANVTWLWGQAPAQFANQVVTQGYISDFMGISMQQFSNSISGATIYFFGNPAEYGRELLLVGPEQTLTDDDIDNKTVRFNMEQLYWQTTASAADVWKLTVS